MAWMIGTPYVATPKLLASGGYEVPLCHGALSLLGHGCTDAGRVSIKCWELGEYVWLGVPPLKGLQDFLARAGSDVGAGGCRD